VAVLRGPACFFADLLAKYDARAFSRAACNARAYIQMKQMTPMRPKRQRQAKGDKKRWVDAAPLS
jgi:hypothetical protein